MKTLFVTHFVFILLVIPNFSWAQYITVSGYVKNETNGKALGNVSIFESNSGIGTITAKNGYYKLLLEKGKFNLNVTDDGFKKFTKEFELNADTSLIVQLVPKVDVKTRHRKNDQIQAGINQEKKNVNKNKAILF